MKCIKNRIFFQKRPTGQGHRGVQIPKNKEFKSPKINTKFHFSDKTKTKNIILTNYLATVTVTLVVHKKRDFFFQKRPGGQGHRGVFKSPNINAKLPHGTV